MHDSSSSHPLVPPHAQEGSYRAVEKADKKIIKEMALTRQFDAIEATYGPKWAAKARGFQERKEEVRTAAYGGRVAMRTLTQRT